MIERQAINPIAQTLALFSRFGKRGCSVFHSCWLIILIGVLCHCSSLEGQTQSDRDDVRAVAETRDQTVCFVVKNLAAPKAATCKVWLADSAIDKSPPMMGTSVDSQGELVFTPRFPVSPGARYVVQVQPDPNSKPTRFEVEVPGKPDSKAQVVGVYPSAERLPENTLKFYLQFSAPMQKGDIYRFVRLREVGGKDVELPFLEIEQEFWSRDSKRLTLLLDPGRIKRGLKPREEMGPILVNGKSYELVVDGSWPDAHGEKLGQEIVKRFLVGPEDHTQPDPAKWEISAPSADALTPLQIQFTDSLDYAMLFRVISIVDSAGHPVKGTVTVSRNEQRWSFQPDQAWDAGTYTISVSENLEDNAGNSIGRPFDVDMFNQTESSEAAPMVELQFEVF